MAAIVEARTLSSSLKILSKKCPVISFVCSKRLRHDDSSAEQSYDIVIAGGGMVGTTLACALANNRRLESKKILLLEASNKFSYTPQEKYSNRVVALNKNTRILLSSIGAWKHIESVRHTPVRKMQVWDACSDAMITFNEDHLEDDLAYIVENDLLLHAVDTILSGKNSVKVINNAKIDDIILSNTTGADSRLHLESGESFRTKLLVS
ncbi:hypothetical protein TKK_0008355 [Trichogramma kaykai]|uniref:FAD dependent oxidoreductase domain-containing protein n=1 Tax=Trichogramma kaykai TaxID=54128 RepID=A0ABD2X676_9HYME